MGSIFTYARVSTLDQNTDSQVTALKAAYPKAVLRQETKSGTTAKDRFILNVILDMIKDGDKLMVWKLDRLARNINYLCNILDTLNSKGGSLDILHRHLESLLSGQGNYIITNNTIFP